MPTYEYRCPNGHEFELFQKMSDEPRADCPDCGEDSERLLSGGAGVVFKGEGFYATDYRSEEYRKKASSEKGETDGAAGSGQGASDAEGGDGASASAGDDASQSDRGGASPSDGSSSSGSVPSSPGEG